MDLQTFILNKVGIDKVLHFLAGGWLSAFAPYKMWWIALLIGIAMGFIKECIDLFIRKSTFCYIDWFATSLGGLVTAIFMFYGLI